VLVAAAGSREGTVLDPLCPDCPYLPAGGQPLCWECERTALGPEAAEALAIHNMLGMGIPGDLAFAAWRRTWTPEEILDVTERIGLIRQELRSMKEEG
jgi:hypothetical protein